MIENQILEKKSIRGILKNNPNWDEIAKDFVCLANSNGGTIIYGIEDNEDLPPIDQQINDEIINTFVNKVQDRLTNVVFTTIKNEYSNGSECLHIIIEKNLYNIACTKKGMYYKRIGDQCKAIMPEELTILLNEKPGFQWETQTQLKIKRNEYDITKLELFASDIRKSERVSDFVKQKTNEELLEHYLLVNGEYLTNLGVIWVGKRIQRAELMYPLIIQFNKYDENGNRVRKFIYDDYNLSPKELIQNIWDDIPDFREFIEFEDGIYRKNIYKYDEVVIRELIANAIVHRLYTQRGDIFINLYPDKLEIQNPGGLPFGVTPQNILNTSIQRNQHLSKIFYDLKLMEKEGSGYDKIYQSLLTFGKKIPEIYDDGFSVKVVVYNSIINKEVIILIDKINSEFQLNHKELLTLSFIANSNSLTLNELISKIGLDEQRIAQDWLKGLLEKNILQKRGKSQGLQYFINPEILRKLKFKGKTNLKSIEMHRLKELILEDLKKYPESKKSEIHQRIGIEIPSRTIRTACENLLKENKINKIGLSKNTVYIIVK